MTRPHLLPSLHRITPRSAHARVRAFLAPALALTLALLTSTAHAATTFNIPDASPQYSARITIETCDASSCSGPAKVELFARPGNQPVQSFTTEDMQILLNEKAQPAVNVTQLYSDQSAIIIADFNFDGSADLAIRNGNNSGYGGPSYDVYVYNSTRKQFVPSDELTDLATSKLGMFQIDAKRKRLITYEKSGCCWHMTTEYAVVPRQGLVITHTLEEAMRTDGINIDVTTSDLVNGKMRSRTRTYKMKDYYKQ